MHPLEDQHLYRASRHPWVIRGIALGLLAAFAFGLMACSNATNAVVASPTDCFPGMAVLVVGESYLQEGCGCAEAPATIPAGTSLTCTVPHGTQIYIYYVGTYLPHQIVSTGSPSFPSSSVSIPGKNPEVRSFSFPIGPAGTYNFEDSYNNELFGQFIST